MKRATRIFLLVLTLVAAGCGGPSGAPVETGSWRAVVTLPGGELPFGLELQRQDDAWNAVLVNGAERVSVPEVEVGRDRLNLVLPAFNNRIEAVRDGAGFAGSLTLVKRGGLTQTMPFRATPGQTHRFFAEPAASPPDLAGRWAVEFVADDGSTTEAVAEFDQEGDEVHGTFLTPTGDYRFLAGQTRGDRLWLSTFDGAHAFLFTAAVADGELRGDFWSGTAWHERWTARRDENASLPDPDSLTRLVGESFHFDFPDTSGRPVSIDDPRFEGKVLLIALSGSWCPNCHDEAAFLAPFYEKYRDRGLEVVGLMFEHMDDFAAAARQVEAFRAKFDIGFTLLVAGNSDKQRAGETMSMLDRVYAYPTSIFIDRSGAVRRIHTGFNGPGTGRHYNELVADFTATVETLLAE